MFPPNAAARSCLNIRPPGLEHGVLHIPEELDVRRVDVDNIQQRAALRLGALAGAHHVHGHEGGMPRQRDGRRRVQERGLVRRVGPQAHRDQPSSCATRSGVGACLPVTARRTPATDSAMQSLQPPLTVYRSATCPFLHGTPV
jgi:hypothetical protein